MIESGDLSNHLVSKCLCLLQGDVGESWGGLSTPLGQRLQRCLKRLRFMSFQFSENLSFQCWMFTKGQGGCCCMVCDWVCMSADSGVM